MKVLCYVDGNAGDSLEISAPPHIAAQAYVFNRHAEAEEVVNVVVEPLDEEAIGRGGWTLRTDGARVRFFRMMPGVWCRKELKSFDTGEAVIEGAEEIAKLRAALVALFAHTPADDLEAEGILEAALRGAP